MEFSKVHFGQMGGVLHGFICLVNHIFGAIMVWECSLVTFPGGLIDVEGNMNGRKNIR